MFFSYGVTRRSPMLSSTLAMPRRQLRKASRSRRSSSSLLVSGVHAGLLGTISDSNAKFAGGRMDAW